MLRRRDLISQQENKIGLALIKPGHSYYNWPAVSPAAVVRIDILHFYSRIPQSPNPPLENHKLMTRTQLILTLIAVWKSAMPFQFWVNYDLRCWNSKCNSKQLSASIMRGNRTRVVRLKGRGMKSASGLFRNGSSSRKSFNGRVWGVGSPSSMDMAESQVGQERSPLEGSSHPLQ